MNQDLIAKARDNTIRVSPLKLANIVRSIVNKKANSAVNQLKFSNTKIDDCWQFSPKYDLIQMTHENKFSKMFIT